MSDLSELREGQGKTLAEVATALGVSPRALVRFERLKNMRVSTLRRYIGALGGEVDFLAVFPDGHRVRVEMSK